ncbi:methyltransferase domain-containing protein [Pontiellaceae bacterium B12219]|nr:methyltransferase domain-containing protein [Pontiellaceae bacterium B12219]
MDTEVRIWQEKLLTRSIRRTRKLDQIKRAIGTTMNLQLLEISEGDGAISTNLRKLGGSWKTAVPSKSAADSINYSLNEPITTLPNEQLPFEDHTFDRVVIVDALKHMEDDYTFLHECHRVLKNDGWVIISETRRFPFSLTALLQQAFSLTPKKHGAFRNGYTAGELFDKLKDGFDVPETITYSNGAFESIATLAEAVQKQITTLPYWLIRENAGKEELNAFRKLYNLSLLPFPMLWILSKLEFIPGHKLLIRSRRRHWRPRLQPKLIDGRSIAEAAINTKIGTAAPF